MDFHVVPIAPDVLDRLRDGDDAGHRTESYVDEGEDSPLRCCLQRSRPGERIAVDLSR